MVACLLLSLPLFSLCAAFLLLYGKVEPWCTLKVCVFMPLHHLKNTGMTEEKAPDVIFKAVLHFARSRLALQGSVIFCIEVCECTCNELFL